MNSNNIKRVARNTFALYIRTFFLIIINLFTYRIVFNVLGASDYGMYNVVGGFVTMFSFLSASMISASQRFFAIDLAGNNWEKLSRTFSVHLSVYGTIALMVLILSETIGIWFVLNKLNLDYSRIGTIIIIYQTSIIIFLLGVMAAPFLALLVADENLGIYSRISIAEGLLKILVAFVIYRTAKYDVAVELYALLLLLVSILTNGCYLTYCFAHYRKLKIKIEKNKDEYGLIFRFLNWNLIGAIASIGKSQGVNIIINIRFGTIVNAERSVSYQVSGAISSFAQNFMKAIDPQIIKAYAGNQGNVFISIIYSASKLSYFLLAVVALPFIANMHYVMTLWLIDVPEYAELFTALVLIDALVLSITDPILTGVQATGMIRNYQLTVGVMSLMNLPISYGMLHIVNNPVIPFVIGILLNVLITFGRLISFKWIYPFSIWQYCKNVIFPIIIVTSIAAYIDIVILGCAATLGELIANVTISVLCLAILIYIIAMSKNEREIVNRYIPILNRKENEV